MPNTIYYNVEEAATKALRVGGFSIGTGDVAKGPTNTTSFFNGINPPSGGYTIYLNKSGNKGPSITCPSNDADLIAQTNSIANASYTTVNECLTFFAGQSDKMVMHNPISTMITDDLAACFSAGTLPSYPRTGTTWYDISVEDNDGTLTNSPTFNSNGWMEFDGVDDKISVGNPTSLNFATDMSCEAVFRRNSNAVTNQRLLSKGGGGASTSQNGFSYFGSNTSISFACTNNAVRNIQSATITTDTWYHVIGIIDQQTNKQKVWLNGVLTNSVTLSGTGTMVGTAEFNIGMFGNSSLPWEGDIESVRIYGKALTDAEVLQNYYQGAIVTDDLTFAIDAGNLVSYYNNVPYNATVNSLVGTVTGTLTNGVAFNGNSGGYWEFDGVDDQLPLSTNINLGNGNIAWTVSAWVKSTTTANSLGQGSVASNDGSGPVYSMMGINSGKIVYWTYQSSAWAQKLGVATVNDGDWHLLTWVNYSDITMDMYVDGVFDKNVTNSTSGNNNPIDTIGNSWAARFDGEIAALHIYQGKSLTAAEVGQNYGATVNRFN